MTIDPTFKYNDAAMALKDPAILDHTMRAEERAAVDRFVAELRRLFGERLDSITLYGSKARGDVHPESDVDILVLTREEPTEDDRVRVAALEVDLEGQTRSFMHLSALLMTRARFEDLRRRERIFALDVEREGVAL